MKLRLKLIRAEAGMTNVLYTVDTELSLGSHQRGVDLETNLQQSVFGICKDGAFGIGYQMQALDAHGLRGVFFVDPMPAEVFGLDIVRRIVDPILAAGHEVQLHIHTEWLKHMPVDPLDGRRGPNIGSFSAADQRFLLGRATELLIAAGAPRPTAFRAGNYGADDTTLKVLAGLGFRYDSSFNPAYLGDPCRIALPATTVNAVRLHGLTEVPVACIHDVPGRLRHAQLCALSVWELRAALAHAVAQAQPTFTIVSHSFELLSRDRKRVNRQVVKRFEAMCRFLADPANGLTTAVFADLPEAGSESGEGKRLPADRARTIHRVGAQLLAALLYERNPNGLPALS